MVKFVIAALSPMLVLSVAAVSGGGWTVAALIWMTVFVTALDRLTSGIPEPASGGQAARALSLVLAVGHFPLLALAVVHLAGATGASGTERVLVYLAMSLFFGQVSNSVAHELIHARDRFGRRLGQLVYVSLLFGHHASAHRLVHHVHVASDGDPNSARPGEGFWRFALRAWTGSFVAGFHAESRLRARSSGTPGLHPYVGYVAGALAMLAIAWMLAGMAGVAACIALAGYAQLQLLLSDYVQHYGLRRRPGVHGRLEPVGPEHSWNAPQWYSAAMMLNAPRHSDHHMRPTKPFPELDIDGATMPVLPHGLPVMAVLALVPPLWRRVMDRRAARWAAMAQPANPTDFSHMPLASRG